MSCQENQESQCRDTNRMAHIDYFPRSRVISFKTLAGGKGGFLGRDGIFRFSLEGIAERGLAVIEVRERDLQVIGPAPASFEGFIN